MTAILHQLLLRAVQNSESFHKPNWCRFVETGINSVNDIIFGSVR